MSGESSPWWMQWSGRNNRQQWWMIVLPAYIVGGIISSIYQRNQTTLWLIIALIVGIITAYLYLSANARRFHDRGKSGWWSLIGLIPIIGTIWVIIECGCLKGDPGSNQYGSPV